jgi:activator of Hsp90 ATPase-like protein
MPFRHSPSALRHPPSDDARFARGQVRLRSTCGLAVALLGLGCAPAAWASYAQFRLDGITFLLAVVLLYWWGVALAIGLALGGGKRKVFVIAATAVTVVLVSLLIAVFADGRATMHQRPLGMWGMFVVLLLAAVPAMLAAPVLQLAQHARGTSSRLPMAMLVGALVLVPVGSGLHLLLQEMLETRTHNQARALTPGRILPHVIASRHRAAGSWLSPYLWNEEAELKWIIIGLGRLSFIESPAPISDEDTQALALLVKLSAGTGNASYTWMLEGKLAWDRLMRAAAGDRFAAAAGLTKQQAQQLTEYIGVPHADWLCTPLADPETERALGHVWTLLSENDKQRFSTAIREKCGRSIGLTDEASQVRRPKPNELIRYTDKFDDPSLPGEMKVTVTLKKVAVGTELTVVQEGIPDVIPAEACYLGWQDSLMQLANLVDPEIPDA